MNIHFSVLAQQYLQVLIHSLKELHKTKSQIILRIGITKECLLIRISEIPDDDAVRLTSGSYGALQVAHDGIWGSVCDTDNSRVAATCSTVCKQLNYE